MNTLTRAYLQLPPEDAKNVLSLDLDKVTPAQCMKLAEAYPIGFVDGDEGVVFFCTELGYRLLNTIAATAIAVGVGEL